MRAVSFIHSAVAAFAFLVLAPQDAQAQGACTGAPGEMVVGMAGGGPGGFQTPLCSSPGGGGSGAAAQPRKSETARRNEELTGAFHTDIAMMMMGLDTMLKNINKRQGGYWEHFGPAKTVEGDFRSCAAVFLKGDHSLMVWGSNNPQNQATLTLMDRREEAVMQPIDVPEIQQVTLEQTGAKPITVNAIRHTFDIYGAVTLVIPSLDMAASGLKDQMNIKVSAGGKELIAMDYNKGIAAKFWLENCINKLPKVTVRQ